MISAIMTSAIMTVYFQQGLEDETQVLMLVHQVLYRPSWLHSLCAFLRRARICKDITDRQRNFHQTPNAEEPAFQMGPHKSLQPVLSATVMEDEQTAQADTWWPCTESHSNLLGHVASLLIRMRTWRFMFGSSIYEPKPNVANHWVL